FAQIDLLWATISFTILASIIIHGVSAGRIIEFAESRKAHIHTGEDADLVSLSPSRKTEVPKDEVEVRRDACP
ncbi:MAG: hypothetical protein WA908_05245, partial [Pontixanthobacter sp.]